MANAQTRHETPDEDAVSLADLLADMSGELANMGERCSVLQWSISSLLDRVDHPDLGAEIHMLQDVDRIHQTLNDLSAILAAARPGAEGVAIGRAGIDRAIRLESLRTRLGLSGDRGDTSHDPDETGVAWL